MSSQGLNNAGTSNQVRSGDIQAQDSINQSTNHPGQISTGMEEGKEPLSEDKLRKAAQKQIFDSTNQTVQSVDHVPQNESGALD